MARGARPLGNRHIDHADWTFSVRVEKGWVKPVLTAHFKEGMAGRDHFLGAEIFVKNNPLFIKNNEHNHVAFYDASRTIEIVGAANYSNFSSWLRNHNKRQQNDALIKTIAGKAQQEEMAAAYEKQRKPAEAPVKTDTLKADPVPEQIPLDFGDPAFAPPSFAAREKHKAASRHKGFNRDGR